MEGFLWSSSSTLGSFIPAVLYKCCLIRWRVIGFCGSEHTGLSLTSGGSDRVAFWQAGAAGVGKYHAALWWVHLV